VIIRSISDGSDPANVPDGPLLLHRRAQRVLDVRVVEGGDRLKFVERDRHAPAPDLGDPSRQREDLFGKSRGVARGADRRKGDRQGGIAGRMRVQPKLRMNGRQQLGGPAAEAARRRVSAEQRAGVRLEKPDVGARGRDGDLDREDPPGREAFQDATDQRRLAVAPWRDEEDLLPLAEVAREAVALLLAVGEGGGGHDFAVDERVRRRHYGILRNDYAKSNTAAGRTGARRFSARKTSGAMAGSTGASALTTSPSRTASAAPSR
jgi:hypothetical protein